MTTQQVVYSEGLYHDPPVLDEKHQDLKAIVVGASGMSGQSMIDLLVQSPQRWSKIYALSRPPPQITDGASSTARSKLTDSVRDAVFFFGYVQLSADERKYSNANSDSAQKLAEVNGKLLQNFLTALSLPPTTPSRILLQTGLEHYAAHLGPAKVPFDEASPRIELGANFYFTQEDILFAHLPNSPGNNRKLGKPLVFPGDTAAWEKTMPVSSSGLNSRFYEWLTVQEATGNERFNIVGDSQFTWMEAWGEVAGWFGMEWPPEEDESRYEVRNAGEA
ncbi:hypothetical protein LTR62_008028 [Meristemomyces frigidus]|uniref:NAD-dependent epimerase/dehydratase domain-containing protein n=1 Tax=Meristemomyces frigidus TaxID=1508187 RepID=A0AAN7TN85_9PEZI|nr:hypothetical protein LTR62_008028 [Meristemomyces frigidus]